MPRTRTAVAAFVMGLCGLGPAAAAAAPVLWTSGEVPWSDLAEPAGARQAPLWSDPATGDKGTLVRWKFNTKVPARTAEHDTHIVILAGTFVLELEGADQKQFGPGAFVGIPKGTQYESGCEAAGECIFVLHQPGPRSPVAGEPDRGDIHERLARVEALVARVAAAQLLPSTTVASGPAPAVPPGAPNDKPVLPAPSRPPALNTPPRLPPGGPENYKKTLPRIDVLLQTRYDHFLDDTRTNTFFLRKAEIGVKGNIIRNVDFSLEVDLARVQANDPYRRTYIRLSHLKHLHLKAGLEKAPLGLEELISNAQQPFVDRSEVSDRFSAAEEVGLFTESVWTSFVLQTSLTNGGRRLYRDDNRAKAFTARAVWAPLPRFSIGAATMQGETGPQLLARTRYNVEAKYGSTNIRGAQGEYYRAKDGSVWSNAFYVQTYWALPVTASWLTHLMPVARFESIDRDDDAVASELKVLTLGGGLLFKENKAKLMLNWLTDIREGNPRKDEFRAQYQVEF